MSSLEIDTRDVVSLIRAHCENDEETFKKIARELVKLFEQRGESQLSLYISALIGDTPSWVPM